ncbi:MAG: ubiquinol-cytochrome c reductase iron-sulfur subunit [Saprospiraceae bacterium]|jgi:ubiquinol-cytochrome c reductase iron-sulfur subunit
MSNDINQSRRRMLTVATVGVGAIGSAAMVVPFGMSLMPSERARAAGAPVEVDISLLEEGQQLTVEWRGKPVWIVKRPKSVIEALPALDSKLADPNSKLDQQPAYAQNANRSREENLEISVLVGICTHLGCSPKYRPELAPADLGGDWQGGYFCACHGSRFDLAGRVYKGVPAPTNLVVPPYQYLTETLLLIGDDGEAA